MVLLGRDGRWFWGVGVGVVDVGCLKKHPKSGKFVDPEVKKADFSGGSY